MDFINKLEKFFNGLVEKLVASFYRLLQHLTPGKYKRKFSRYNDAWQERKISIFQRLILVWKKIQSKLKGNVHKAKQLNPKSRIKGKINKLRTDIPKAFTKENLKKTPSLLAPCKKFIQSMKPEHIVLSVFIATFGLVSFLALFFSGNRLIKQSGSSRAPASKEKTAIMERKFYHKMGDRHIRLNKIQIPVHFVDINEIRRTDIEFVVTTSNRFTKQYLLKYEYLLRDHLFSTLEPVVPSFPLDIEGKAIIKDKVQREVDKFLEKNKIRGEVEDVYIDYILSI